MRCPHRLVSTLRIGESGPGNSCVNTGTLFVIIAQPLLSYIGGADIQCLSWKCEVLLPQTVCQFC